MLRDSDRSCGLKQMNNSYYTKLFQSEKFCSATSAMNATGLLLCHRRFQLAWSLLDWRRGNGPRQGRIGSQRWDALTGLPPAGARIVKEAGANE
jgi:hypothetical protein